MTLFNFILYVLTTGATAAAFFYLRGRNSKVGMILCFSFFLRCTLALVLESAMKYVFVVDNISYESHAWSMAQNWLFSTSLDNLPGSFVPNFYEYVLACFFYVAGKQPLVPEFFNAACGTACGYLVYRLSSRFFLRRSEPTRASLLTLWLVTLYPSFVVWSAVNIRDPLYILFCLIAVELGLTLTSAGVSPIKRAWVFAWLTGALYVVHSIRGYAVYFLVTGFAVGVIARMIRLRLNAWLTFAVLPLLALGIGALALPALAPTFTQQALAAVQGMRLALINFGADDVAQSAFGMDHSFDSTWGVLSFIPTGLTYYFFAPFPWALDSLLEKFSLPEVLLVYALTLPTLRGIVLALKSARGETLMVGYLVLVMAVSQSVVVSNVGTLFRHRTLSFVLLSIFTGIGLNAGKKENRPDLLAA